MKKILFGAVVCVLSVFDANGMEGLFDEGGASSTDASGMFFRVSSPDISGEYSGLIDWYDPFSSIFGADADAHDAVPAGCEKGFPPSEFSPLLNPSADGDCLLDRRAAVLPKEGLSTGEKDASAASATLQPERSVGTKWRPRITVTQPGSSVPAEVLSSPYVPPTALIRQPSAPEAIVQPHTVGGVFCSFQLPLPETSEIRQKKRVVQPRTRTSNSDKSIARAYKDNVPSAVKRGQAPYSAPRLPMKRLAPNTVDDAVVANIVSLQEEILRVLSPYEQIVTLKPYIVFVKKASDILSLREAVTSLIKSISDVRLTAITRKSSTIEKLNSFSVRLDGIFGNFGNLSFPTDISQPLLKP